MYTTENQTGAALETAERTEEILDRIFGNNGNANGKTRKVRPVSDVTPIGNDAETPDYKQPVLAIFCFEEPSSLVGQFTSRIAAFLAKGSLAVHLFARADFDLADVTVHPVGSSEEGDVVDQVQEFARRAGNEFLRLFRTGAQPVTLFGCEWSAVPVMTLLQGIKNLNVLWALHSLERQRSDMTSDLSKRIDEIELSALRTARAILVNEPAVADVASACVPECVDRILNKGQVFPIHRFDATVDAGAIKARYQVGPVDPTILFVGDLDERYGPDLLVKAMPAILKNHPQARLIIVGDGKLYWPLRVYTRYLLLEHAVRLVGSVQGPALDELVQAADIIAVPSRDTTPWWPFLAAWAARRPVVATHEAAPAILANEQDSVLCYPSENSCVWGIERVLFDEEMGRTIAAKGHEKLQDRFGWKRVAAQVEEFLAASATLES